jgi:hypothetical protein
MDQILFDEFWLWRAFLFLFLFFSCFILAEKAYDFFEIYVMTCCLYL